MKYKFKWSSSFMSQVYYEVRGDGPVYRLAERHSPTDYERSITNYTPDEWERNVVQAIGLIHKDPCSWELISEDVVDAFNAWRQEEHENHLRHLDENPQRYGIIPDDDPIRTPPPIVRGAHYVIGEGWIVNP